MEILPYRWITGTAPCTEWSAARPDPMRRFSLMSWDMAAGMVLSLGGELDVATAETLVSRIHALVGEGHQRIVLDLGHLQFCDCSGLRALFVSRRFAAQAGGWVRIARAKPMLQRTIRIAGLAESLFCYPTTADALADTLADTHSSTGQRVPDTGAPPTDQPAPPPRLSP